MNELIFLTIFIILIFILIIIDTFVFPGKKKIITLKNALISFIIYFALGILFGLILIPFGHNLHNISNINELKYIIQKNKHLINIENLSFDQALKFYNYNLFIEYLSGFFLEKILSIDNIFIFYLIFNSLNVSEYNYRKVLIIGILSAIFFRFIFIFSLTTLIQKFEFVLIILGLILIFSGYKSFKKDENNKIINNKIINYIFKKFRFKLDYQGSEFITKENFKYYFTPLFASLLLIETTDIIFAIDSVSAILSISRDPYIIFFSNIFAILGLRSLFYFIQKIINYFKYLKKGISFLLIFIGLKLVFHEYVHKIGLKPIYSFVIIFFFVLFCILLSIIKKDKKNS